MIDNVYYQPGLLFHSDMINLANLFENLILEKSQYYVAHNEHNQNVYYY